MRDVLLVKVVKPHQTLVHIPHHLLLVKEATIGLHFRSEVATCDILHHDTYVLHIVVNLFEADDVIRIN